MPKYLVVEKSFIGNTIVEVGTTIDFDGPAGSNLQAVDGNATPANNAADLVRQAVAAKGVDSEHLDNVVADQAAAAAIAAQTEQEKTAALVKATAEAAVAAAAAANPNNLV